MLVATLVVNTHLVMAVEDNELNGVLASYIACTNEVTFPPKLSLFILAAYSLSAWIQIYSLVVETDV